jgi:DNA-binding XRE family transcriptional regulator
MAESLMLDRVKFHKKGVQSRFILRSKILLGLSWIAFAKKLNINPRTLSDWAKEKFNMSLDSAKMIAMLTKLPIPKGYSVVRWNSHMKNISKHGGQARIVKYGRVSINEEYRKEKWEQWWKEIGQYKENAKGFQSILKIKKPTKSKYLAEFVGIMLGDGGINKYDISVTLSSEEKQYVRFISDMVNKLFGVTPKIHRLKYAKAVKLFVNRKQLVDFCQQIGLIQGNKIKHQINIPEWIKEDKRYSKACIMGLIDTDGCFYTNSYCINGKRYSYFKIAFTSASKPLILSVTEILKHLDIKARISKNNKDVRIEDSKYVLKYIQEIGSHNHKHLKKIKNGKMAGIC